MIKYASMAHAKTAINALKILLPPKKLMVNHAKIPPNVAQVSVQTKTKPQDAAVLQLAQLTAIALFPLYVLMVSAVCLTINQINQMPVPVPPPNCQMRLASAGCGFWLAISGCTADTKNIISRRISHNSMLALVQ
jgi:hypothetical protein